MMKIMNLLIAFCFLFVTPSYLFGADRVFYENFEVTDFSEHFMERTYTSTYESYWNSMKAAVSQSTDSYSGNYSMTCNLFGGAPGRSLGIPGLNFGNTQNFNLASAISGTQLYLRWKQKHQAGADWGGVQSKQIYLNYRNQGQFVVTIAQRHDQSWLLSIHSQDPYEYTLVKYFSSIPHTDGTWHTYEVFFDWTGQDHGGSCVCDGNNCNSTNGTGMFWFKIDGNVAYEKNNVCYKRKALSMAPIRQIGWPSNMSGTGQSGTAYTWLDDLEIWDGLPGVEPDDNAPVITIANPSSATYSTSSNSLDISGSCSDDHGVTSVSWSNNRGGSGEVEGNLASWSAAGITLLEGNNIITVTARDAAGHSATDVVNVAYASSSSAPMAPQGFREVN